MVLGRLWLHLIPHELLDITQNINQHTDIMFFYKLHLGSPALYPVFLKKVLDIVQRYLYISRTSCGNNSVVECNLAKVEVAGSNPVSRSISNQGSLLAGCLFHFASLQICTSRLFQGIMQHNAVREASRPDAGCRHPQLNTWTL